MLDFEPNGLLSFGDEKASDKDQHAKDASFSFVPNGLLGGTLVPTSEETDTRNDDTDATKDFAALSPMVPNGLLPILSDVLRESVSGGGSSENANTGDEDVNMEDRSEHLPTSSRKFPSLPGSATSTNSSLLDTSRGGVPLGGIRCRAFDGRVVTFMRRPKPLNRAPLPSTSRDDPDARLLETPIHRLLDQLAESAVDTTVPSNVEATQASTSKIREDLWVDRYRPQKFTDLMGDERVNRDTMAWLKEWDQCVFGRRKKRKLKRSRNDQAAPEEENVNTDEWHRPREKILLISGPPGLGKTTLAHVVARQAGYSVLEINASDARSGSIIEERVRPALEAGHAMGSSKPVLVVIDEVDGATGDNSGAGAGFINKLVGLTFDPPKKKYGKGGQKAKRPLLRPIICICNDLYANSLTKLRAYARIIRMKPSAPHLLSKRLATICTMEDLRAETRALSLLGEVCQGDLRSCLNALQLIKMRSHVVTESVVRIATIGIKESETTMQSVWDDLLTPISKKRAQSLGITEEEESKYVSRLIRSIDGSGNVDRVVLGIFEHYATLHPHEATLRRFEGAIDWLTSYDTLSSTMRSEQEYALQGYLPYCVAPLYKHLAASGNPKVERPTVYWDCFSKTKSSEEVYSSFAKTILHPEGYLQQGQNSTSASYRHLLSKDVLRTEFVPLLNRIISPPIRPVNKQIIKGDERIILKKLVDIMVSTGLRFEQDKADDGQQVYRLQPPIDVFVTYDGKRAADIALSRYAVRHMVAEEIDAEIAVRSRTVIEKETVKGGKRDLKKSRAVLEGDGIDIADKPATDFFGRPIELAELMPSQKPVEGGSAVPVPALPPKLPFIVNYVYNEGNSNAVRKPTKMSSFL